MARNGVRLGGPLMVLFGLGLSAQSGRVALPATTVSVKVERGWAVAQTGARKLAVYDMSEPGTFGKTLTVDPAEFEVYSALVIDYSVAPGDVLYVSAYVNFGLGERRYALLRYDLRQKELPALRHLPGVGCPHLGAGEHGVWCIDPLASAARHAVPMLHWIAWMGGVKSYPLELEGDAALGSPRVVVGDLDRAVVWWTVRRTVLDVEPERGIVQQSPIAVFGQGHAITSFVLAPGGRVQALLPLRGDGEETLTTPYALAELDAGRKQWRRLLKGTRFVRGAQLAGWSAGRLWIWNRRGHAIEPVEGVVE
jgi:hypothetical protein